MLLLCCSSKVLPRRLLGRCGGGRRITRRSGLRDLLGPLLGGDINLWIRGAVDVESLRLRGRSIVRRGGRRRRGGIGLRTHLIWGISGDTELAFGLPRSPGRVGGLRHSCHRVLLISKHRGCKLFGGNWKTPKFPNLHTEIEHTPLEMLTLRPAPRKVRA